MADTFFHPIDIAISNDNAQPPSGFARLQVKSNGRLHVKANGEEQILEPTIVTELIVDGGNANSNINNAVLVFDFGSAQ